MWIKSIILKNFGKHLDLKLNFDKGLNIIYGENEYGKSTIVAAIEAIYNGFKPANSRAYPFFPWNSNKLELSATIQLDEMEYEVSRSMTSKCSGNIIYSLDGEKKEIKLNNRKISEIVDENLLENTLWHFDHDNISAKSKMIKFSTWKDLISSVLFGDDGLSFDNVKKLIVADSKDIYINNRNSKAELNELNRELEEQIKLYELALKDDERKKDLLEQYNSLNFKFYNITQDIEKHNKRAGDLNLINQYIQLKHDYSNNSKEIIKNDARNVEASIYIDNKLEKQVYYEHLSREYEENSSDLLSNLDKINSNKSEYYKVYEEYLQYLRYKFEEATIYRSHLDDAIDLKISNLQNKIASQESEKENYNKSAIRITSLFSVAIITLLFLAFISSGYQFMVPILVIVYITVYIIKRIKVNKFNSDIDARLLICIEELETLDMTDSSAHSHFDSAHSTHSHFDRAKRAEKSNDMTGVAHCRDVSTSLDMTGERHFDSAHNTHSHFDRAKRVEKSKTKNFIKKLLEIEQNILQYKNMKNYFDSQKEIISKDLQKASKEIEDINQLLLKSYSTIDVDICRKKHSKRILLLDRENEYNKKISELSNILKDNQIDVEFEIISLRDANIPEIVIEIRNAVSKLQDEKNTISRNIGSIDEVMTNSEITDASIIKSKIENLNNEIEVLKEKYDRLQFIDYLLDYSKERMIRDNQPSFVDYVNRNFPKIVGEKDREIMVSYTGDIMVKVEGMLEVVGIETLSTGTISQLILLIKLALLETLDKECVIPFVIDGSFGHFDDKRTENTINLLSKLSKKRQVIVFTSRRIDF